LQPLQTQKGAFPVSLLLTAVIKILEDNFDLRERVCNFFPTVKYMPTSFWLCNLNNTGHPMTDFSFWSDALNVQVFRAVFQFKLCGGEA
jgi:hypothetical protein